MTAPLALTLLAPEGHALAETVTLAFAARGTALLRQIVPGPAGAITAGPLRLVVAREGEGPLTLTDLLPILELVEDLHPDQPLLPRDPLRRAAQRQSLAALTRLAALIDRLTHTGDQRDVDLNTHLLREQIAQLGPVIAPDSQANRGITLLDLAAAPLLWRLAALDRAFETHLTTGFDRLRDRGIWLVRHPLIAEVLLPSQLALWLDALRDAQGLITRTADRTDWSRALGPAGQAGKKLPPTARRKEIHSIGSGPRIR